MTKTFIALLALIMLTTATSVYADECKSELAETMHDIKDSMKKIYRYARRVDQDNLASEVDNAMGLVKKAKDQSLLIYQKLSGNELKEAKDYYAKNMDNLEKLLLSLKDADSDRTDEILDDIKSLQKKSHRKLKEC